jgi:hypothetical protein
MKVVEFSCGVSGMSMRRDGQLAGYFHELFVKAIMVTTMISAANPTPTRFR